MSAENTGRSKLAELMAYHIFSNIYRYKLIPIMNCNGMPYKIRRNHRSSCPCLNHGLLTAFIHCKNLVLQFYIYIGTFF